MTIPDGYAQANFIFSGDALPEGAQITLGLDVSAFAGLPTDLAIGLADDYDSTLAHNQCDTVDFVSVHVKFGPDNTGPAGDAPGTGGLYTAGEAVMPNCALLINKTTSHGGRSGRGRMFLPGIPNAQVDDGGVVAGGFLTEVNGDLVTFMGKIEARDCQVVLLHGAASPVSLPYAVDQMLAQGKIATQRRRLRR
jgi:hypothetical protein